MEEIKNIVKNVIRLNEMIARDVFPGGAEMYCATCGKKQHLTPEECGQGLSKGWPTCCGHGMIMEGFDEV